MLALGILSLPPKIELQGWEHLWPGLFLNLILHLMYLLCISVDMPQCLLEGQRVTCGKALSFHHVGLGAQTQVSSFGSKHLSLPDKPFGQHPFIYFCSTRDIRQMYHA